MFVKQLDDNEILSALDLVWSVFEEFEAPDYSEEGTNTFKNFISNKTMMLELDFYGAFIDNEMLGIIAVRKLTHIAMLFIEKKYHRKGVAKLLFRHILEITKKEIFTVNSSPYAVEFYHRLGFVDTDSEKEVNGIKFTPMQYMKS